MYIVIKTVKGRQYRYAQRSYRQGGKVRTESIYLGPLGSVRRAVRKALELVGAQRLSPAARAVVRAEKHAAEVVREQRERFGETAEERAQRERQEALDRLHDAYGLRLGGANPAPVEAPTAPAEAEESDESGR